ncbi:MAG: GDYXXLXY domain-containing protein [Acidobacteriota bacterium]
MMVRGIIFWSVTLVVFGVLNALILHKKSVLTSGHTLLLRLAPLDPRSLMQGDYMTLSYDIAMGPAAQAIEASHADGQIVVTLDDHNVASFLRMHRSEPLGEGERLLRYRRRGGLRLGAESFFFQEGQADLYSGARYGELKVTPAGDSVLVGLRGENFELLGAR